MRIAPVRLLLAALLALGAAVAWRLWEHWRVLNEPPVVLP